MAGSRQRLVGNRQNHRFMNTETILTLKALVIAQHPSNVFPRFRIRRNGMVPLDPSFSCIIGGHGQAKVAVESIKQITDVARSSTDILIRVVKILYAMPNGGFRNQLHQSDSAGF